MTSAVLHLGNNRIVLDADADLNRLRIEIDQAIRMGGGWVDVPGAPRFGSVYISPGQHGWIGTSGRQGLLN